MTPVILLLGGAASYAYSSLMRIDTRRTATRKIQHILRNVERLLDLSLPSYGRDVGAHSCFIVFIFLFFNYD